MNVIAAPDVRAARSIPFTTIGAICDEYGGEVQTGPFGSQLHASDYSVAGTPVVMPQDMVNGRIVTYKIARVSQEHVVRLPQHRLQTGDIVYSRRGDVSRFAIVTEAESGWLCGTGSIRVRLNSPDFDIRFLRRFLQQDSVRSWLENEAKGVTMLNLNTSIIRNLPVAFLPLDDQRRIAAILDQADALRAKRREALAQLDEMARAIFVEMFGDLEANDRSWPLSRVASYVVAFQGGKSFESDPDNAAARYRVLKVSAVTGSVFKPHESKPLPDAYVPPDDHFVRSGDLLFSRANTTELVGAVAYVHSTPDNLVLPDKLWRFVWREATSVEPLFIWALFQQRAVKEEIGRRATGTSGSMKNISQEKLLGMETILPPVTVQRAFVSRLIAVQQASAKGKKSVFELDSLFTSLQHRAFRGEL